MDAASHGIRWIAVASSETVIDAPGATWLRRATWVGTDRCSSGAGTERGRDDDRRELAQRHAFDDRALDRVLALAARGPVAAVQDHVRGRNRPGHARARRQLRRRRDLQPQAAPGEPRAIRVMAFDRALEHVAHVEQARDRGVARTHHHVVRRSRLQRAAAVQDRDAVGQRRRLVEIVRDQHDRHRERAAQRGQLAIELVPRHAVDGGERFVEQQHLRVARERAGDRDALLLAAGQRRRPPRLEARPGAPAPAARAPARRAPPAADARARRSRCAARTGAGTARSAGTRGRPSAAAAFSARRSPGRTRHRRRTRPGPPAGARDRRSHAAPSTCRCRRGR